MTIQIGRELATLAWLDKDTAWDANMHDILFSHGSDVVRLSVGTPIHFVGGDLAPGQAVWVQPPDSICPSRVILVTSVSIVR